MVDTEDTRPTYRFKTSVTSDATVTYRDLFTTGGQFTLSKEERQSMVEKIKKTYDYVEQFREDNGYVLLDIGITSILMSCNVVGRFTPANRTEERDVMIYVLGANARQIVNWLNGRNFPHKLSEILSGRSNSQVPTDYVMPEALLTTLDKLYDELIEFSISKGQNHMGCGLKRGYRNALASFINGISNPTPANEGYHRGFEQRRGLMEEDIEFEHVFLAKEHDSNGTGALLWSFVSPSTTLICFIIGIIIKFVCG